MWQQSLINLKIQIQLSVTSIQSNFKNAHTIYTEVLFLKKITIINKKSIKKQRKQNQNKNHTTKLNSKTNQKVLNHIKHPFEF